MKNKKGKGSSQGTIVTVSIVLIALVAVAAFLGWQPSFRQAAIDSGLSTSQLKELSTSAALTCPTDGDTSLTLELINYLNDTSTTDETFDATVIVRDLDSGQIFTLTDTTNPSATTINCGDRFSVEVTSSNANDGDNSRVETIVQGADGATLKADGTVEFVPTKASYGLKLGVSQHGVLEFRAFDNNNNGFMCESGDACTDYELDGVAFESTSNSTALAIGAGGAIDMSLEARTTLPDTDFNDYYTLVLVEAPLATWNEPTVKVNGQKLANIKGSGLTPEEVNQFNAYEYVYKIDADTQILDQGDGIDVDFYMSAKSGVDPSVDPEIDFATAGRYADGTVTKVGAADSSSTNAVVYTVQDVTINIS